MDDLGYTPRAQTLFVRGVLLCCSQIELVVLKTLSWAGWCRVAGRGGRYWRGEGEVRAGISEGGLFF